MPTTLAHTGLHALPARPATLARALVAWFDDNRRSLPWREERTPYRVWLSEVMLQQTRVAVVVDYFERFVKRFPDVDALAKADEAEVLSLWSGLGYYSRGRNLHRAARAVVASATKTFPRTVDELRALPGVGDYTASAVASLAFGERAAVVDGNVLRVLARLCDNHDPVDAPKTKQRAHARALALVDGAIASRSSSGALNEALMELGALVCTPRSPSCPSCPWRSSCAAHAAGTVGALPVKSPKRARTPLHVACVVVVDERGRTWLEKRAARGLFGGLLEPPSLTLTRPVARDTPDANAVSDDAAVRAAWRAILAERGVAAPGRFAKPVVVERTLTHRDLRFSVARVDVDSAAHRGAPFVDDVAAAPVSSAVRAVLAAVT